MTINRGLDPARLGFASGNPRMRWLRNIRKIHGAAKVNPIGIGYGFAAGCEAVAVPRRLPGCITWAVPLVRIWPPDSESTYASSDHLTLNWAPRTPQICGIEIRTDVT